MYKKETFMKGTFILAVAALVARLLGLIQRIPLAHMLQDIGNASFTISSSIYLMLLTVATAGIPSTISKLVSERYALGKAEEAEQIYRAAVGFAVVAGIGMTLFLWTVAPSYARITRVPQAWLAIRALAPALLLFPVIAMMRGYLQGRGNMVAGAISQIVEQVMRVGIGLLIAYFLLRADYEDATIAAGASFGGVMGSIGALMVMLYFTKRTDQHVHREQGHSVKAKVSFKTIYWSIFTLSIPLVLSALVVPAVNFIDCSIVGPLLGQHIGSEQATHQLSILGLRAQSIAGIPPIIAIALSQSLLPVISAAFARRDCVHLQTQITLSLQTAIFTGTPIILFLCTAVSSINELLFSSSDGNGVISFLTLITIFQIMMMTTSSILLGLGKSTVTMKSVFIGLIFKIILSVTLASFLGIYGIISATGICFFVITWLNLRVIKKNIPFSIMGKSWRPFFFVVLFSAFIGFIFQLISAQLIYVLPIKTAYFICCCIVGFAVISAYVILLVCFEVFNKQQFIHYPKRVRHFFEAIIALRQRKEAKQSSK